MIRSQKIRVTGCPIQCLRCHALGHLVKDCILPQKRPYMRAQRQPQQTQQRQRHMHGKGQRQSQHRHQQSQRLMDRVSPGPGKRMQRDPRLGEGMVRNCRVRLHNLLGCTGDGFREILSPSRIVLPILLSSFHPRLIRVISLWQPLLFSWRGRQSQWSRRFKRLLLLSET